MWTRRVALTFEGRDDRSPPCHFEGSYARDRTKFMYLINKIVAGRHSHVSSLSPVGIRLNGARGAMRVGQRLYTV